MEDSSQPFRAFLGAILSVHQNLPVQASELTPSDDIPEEEDAGILEEEDNGNPEEEVPRALSEDDNGSGLYIYSPSTSSNSLKALTTHFQMAASHHTTPRGPRLMVCPLPSCFLSASSFVYLQISSSSPHSSKSFQVWVHLHPLHNNKFDLPLYAKNGDKKQHLWLTRVIGSGSTGTVWQCRPDTSDSLFAVKVVEMLRGSDVERQQRFYNEFGVYLSLELAYQSKQLCDRITPHCYGGFKGKRINVLILELCNGTLKSWDELNISEQ